MCRGIAICVVALAVLADPGEATRYLVLPAGHAEVETRLCPASLSADGAVVAFDAVAPLEPSDRNGVRDVYVFDRTRNEVALVSRGRHGGAGDGASTCPAISGDGNRVVFESVARDLVTEDAPGTAHVYVHDRRTGSLRRLSNPSVAASRSSSHACISGDGRVAVFHTRDMEGPPTSAYRLQRVPLDSDAPIEDLGEGHGPTVSEDGAVIAYVTSALPGEPPAIGVLAHGRSRVLGRPDGAGADGAAHSPTLSRNGRWIAYVSRATNLIAGRRMSGRAHVYLERVEDGLRYLVSATGRDREANGQSVQPAIDNDGTRIVFASTATNLGCGTHGRPDCGVDINLLADVFLWDVADGRVTRVNAATPELAWLESSTAPAISGDGGVVSFLSRQPVSGADDRDTFDVFVSWRGARSASAGPPR